MYRRIHKLLVVPILLPRLWIDPYRSSVGSIYPRLNVLDRSGRFLQFRAWDEKSQGRSDRVEVRESTGIGKKIELRGGEIDLAGGGRGRGHR